MKEIKVFIASTGAYSNKVNELTTLLKEHVTVTPWNSSFNFGETNIEVLEKEVSKCDFFIVLLTAEDLTCKKKKMALQPRDNLIYELGLSTGTLGRFRALGIVDTDPLPNLPTDLDGVVLKRFEIKSNDFAQNAKVDILDHISKFGPKSDKDKELAFLYLTTKVLSYQFYPNTNNWFINNITHGGDTSFREINDVVDFIENTLNDYLCNCIPGVWQGNLYIGYQYYLGDGVKIKNRTFSVCKDTSPDGYTVDGKFVMGISSKSRDLQEWRIGRVSPGYDSLNCPLSVCASVYKSLDYAVKSDTSRQTEGPINYLTPGEKSLYSYPVSWSSGLRKASLGVLSISGREPPLRQNSCHLKF